MPDSEPDPPEPLAGLPGSYFPLLDLPGEIRNLIYEYLLESDRITLHEAKLLLLRRASNTDHDQSKKSESGRSFTHTCSQLRAEFLPLFQGSTTIYISSSNINRHISDTYPDRANAIGRLVVSVALTHSPTDLGSVIHLAALAPRMRVSLYPHGLSDSRHRLRGSLLVLASVGNNDRNSVWRNVVLQHLQRLLLVFEKEEPHLVIQLKYDDTRRWTTPMGFPSISRRYLAGVKADPKETQAWKIKVGLGGLRLPHGQLIFCQRCKEYMRF